MKTSILLSRLRDKMPELWFFQSNVDHEVASVYNNDDLILAIDKRYNKLVASFQFDEESNAVYNFQSGLVSWSNIHKFVDYLWEITNNDD